jgi:hypothetical protein
MTSSSTIPSMSPSNLSIDSSNVSQKRSVEDEGAQLETCLEASFGWASAEKTCWESVSPHYPILHEQTCRTLLKRQRRTQARAPFPNRNADSYLSLAFLRSLSHLTMAADWIRSFPRDDDASRAWVGGSLRWSQAVLDGRDGLAGRRLRTLAGPA